MSTGNSGHIVISSIIILKGIDGEMRPWWVKFSDRASADAVRMSWNCERTFCNRASKIGFSSRAKFALTKLATEEWMSLFDRRKRYKSEEWWENAQDKDLLWWKNCALQKHIAEWNETIMLLWEILCISLELYENTKRISFLFNLFFTSFLKVIIK